MTKPTKPRGAPNRPSGGRPTKPPFDHFTLCLSGCRRGFVGFVTRRRGLQEGNQAAGPRVGFVRSKEVPVVPHSTAGLSDKELAKKAIDIPISDITLRVVAVVEE